MRGNKTLRAWHRLFHRLLKNCGKLNIEGRELWITDVTDEEFVVQDVFGREPALRVKRTDERIADLELRSAFI